MTGAIEQLPERVRTLAELAPLLALREAAPVATSAVYLVGGGVRDLLLGRSLVDVDLATAGEPEELAGRLGASAVQATRFGTVSVQVGGLRYDISRTRRERYPHPGALPDVEPADIETDLLRRDFTVNAIAFGLLGAHADQTIAAPGALGDLATGRLAILHDTSFADDPTRLLRLARYAARLGFAVETRTRELASQAIVSHALDTVSGTRIGNELRLLAAEPDPVAAFQVAADLGLPWSIDADLATRALSALPADGRRDVLVLAVVLADSVAQLDDLGFSAADRDAITQAAKQSARLAQHLRQARSRSEIAEAVATARIETVALASAQGAPDQSRSWLTDLRHQRLDISGADLIAGGVPEGPVLGRGLAAARKAMFDGLAPDHDSQLAVALRAAR